MYNGVVVGTEGSSRKKSSHFESEWRGLLKLVPGKGRVVFFYTGELEGDVSGRTTEEGISECDVVIYPTAEPSTAKSRSSTIYEYSAYGKYPGNPEAALGNLIITSEGYILGLPGGSMSMPGRFRKTYMSRGKATGALGSDFELYSGNSDDSNEGECSVYFHGVNSYGIKKPLPSEGLILTGQQTFSEKFDMPNGYSRYSYTYTWTITPARERQPLKAVINAPFNVKHGEKVLLDGSESTGDITEYKWTFNGGYYANDDAVILDRQSEVTLLEHTEVTLAVTDGQEWDYSTRIVNVLPRDDFKTKIKQTQEEGRIDKSDSPVCTSQNGVLTAKWKDGENVCDIDLSMPNPHCLHPDPDTAALDEMFTLEQVNDLGPFGGVYFFRDWKMSLERKILINKYILPDGKAYQDMGQNFYTYNKEQGRDVDNYLKELRKHERRHGELMKEALNDNDPARKCESAMGRDEGELKKYAKEIIISSEKTIHTKSEDPLPVTLRGDMFMKQMETNLWRELPMKVGAKEVN
jgi:hypothetical protein